MTKHRKQPITNKTIREAERRLSKSDPVMKRLIADHGPCPLADWEYHPFHTLVISIISQQLSAKAADTIEKRISEIVSVSLDSNTDRLSYRCRLYRPGMVAATPP